MILKKNTPEPALVSLIENLVTQVYVILNINRCRQGSLYARDHRRRRYRRVNTIHRGPDHRVRRVLGAGVRRHHFETETFQKLHFVRGTGENRSIRHVVKNYSTRR
jgi:hypothetical protein